MKPPDDIVTIIGGGWSVASVGLKQLPGIVIAVNDSAIHAPRWNYCVSMDRVWTEHRIVEVLNRTGIENPPRNIWIRRAAAQNRTEMIEAAGVTVFDNNHLSVEMSDDPKRLNGTNSGVCAINLAYKMRPRLVYLLGFDMCRRPASYNGHASGEAYWYPAYDWVRPGGNTSDGKYEVWRDQFARIAQQFKAARISVVNVSPRSLIEDFPKMTPAQFAQVLPWSRTWVPVPPAKEK